MFDRLLIDNTLCCFKKPSMEMSVARLQHSNAPDGVVECLNRSLGILATAWPPSGVSGPVANVGDDSRPGCGAGVRGSTSCTFCLFHSPKFPHCEICVAPCSKDRLRRAQDNWFLPEWFWGFMLFLL